MRQSLTTTTTSREALAVRRSPPRSSRSGLAIAVVMAPAAAPGCGFGNAGKPGADGGGPGGGPDGGDGGSPPGTGFCYGPSGWQVCLDAKASGQVQLDGTLDTDKSNANGRCLKSQPDTWAAMQPEACII